MEKIQKIVFKSSLFCFILETKVYFFEFRNNLHVTSLMNNIVFLESQEKGYCFSVCCTIDIVS